MTEKRTFTKEEKLQILKEVEQEGVKVTLEKHGICPAGWHLPADTEWCTLENFVDAGLRAYFWTSKINGANAWFRQLDYDNVQVFRS